MAAASNYAKHCRSWNFDDSIDGSDVERLFQPESVKFTKPARCVKYWSLYASICVFFALFLLGLLVGFYVRDDQKVQHQCAPRKDGLNNEKLQAVHNNIVYVMSGDKIHEYVRELSPLKPKTFNTWDEDHRTAKVVEKEFRKFGFSQVNIEEHDVVVTSPDPARPNRLEVLYPDGSTVYNISYDNGKGEKLHKNNELAPLMVVSPAGKAEGPLVYGRYGTPADFLAVQTTVASLQGMLVLMKVGQISVSEKVMRAKRFGAVGVLLYCEEEHYHGNQCQDTEVVSWADFDAQDDVTQSLPVQTVSLEVATHLLRSLNQSDTSLVKGQPGNVDNRTGLEGMKFSVKLQINNKPVNRKVYNVVGTIAGSEEPDRLVLVGAGRQSAASTFHDRVSSTAMLLELGRSLSYIKAVEGWQPRRTIRLVSWGGHAWSKSGMLNHIQDNYETLHTDAVTYIDIDLQSNTSDVMKYLASPGLEKTVQMAASMTEDPVNPEISLTDSWSQYDKLSVAHSINVGLTGLPIMHQLGIPSTVIQAAQMQKKFNQRDTTQHYKFHLASARVVSHVLLGLADLPLLHIHVDFFIDLMQQLVTSSIQHLKLAIPETKIASLQADIHHLVEAGQSFPDSSTDHCALSLKIREINDIVMRLDKTFFQSVTSNRYHQLQYLLREDKQTGTLHVFNEALRIYKVSGNIEPVNNIVDIVHRSVREMTSLLTLYHSR